MKPEIFLPFPEHEEILISNLGNVYKKVVKERNKPIVFKQLSVYNTDNKFNQHSYFYVYKDGKAHKYSLARAVAKLFLNTPKNVTKVIHLNLDNFDNRAENLKWKIK